jgi:hypothetical protein
MEELRPEYELWNYICIWQLIKKEIGYGMDWLNAVYNKWEKMVYITPEQINIGPSLFFL